MAASPLADFVHHCAMIIGASEVRNLFTEINDAENRRYPISWNFGLDWDDAQIFMSGVGGRKVDGVQNDLHVVDMIRPDVVLLAVGGNDLSVMGHEGRPEVVGYKLSNLAEDLHYNHGVARVIVSSIGPRFPPYCGYVYPYDYNNRVAICNQYLDVVLGDTEFASFWDHSRQFAWGRQLFLDDGVHFNYWGTKSWYKSLRGSLIKAFKDNFN